MESIPEQGTPILVVDDDPGLLLSIKTILVSAGLPEPALVSDSSRVDEISGKHPFQVVLIDLLMPHVSGMQILRGIKERRPETECIVITAVDEVGTAVQAMRYGAFDYLVKPVQAERLIITVQNALEKHNLRLSLTLHERSPTSAHLKNPDAFRDMAAADESMFRVFQQAEAYALTDYNLMITGETGVGKEMLARIIHRLSRRSAGPFVAVNMAAFSKTLFEDEFFGHARGAFTGAQEDRKGFIEETRGGTLFMDEIADLERDLQAKLLRVIEEKEIYRLGSSKARKVDLRIICSSNRDVLEEVEKGNFRRDLLHRLNVCRIHIPPLRERKKDILPLAYHFLKRHAVMNRKDISFMTPDLERFFQSYAFPGNVRELENLILASVIAERGNALSLSSLSGEIAPPAHRDAGPEEGLLLEDVEKQHICRVLASVGGNRTRAARILGIGLRTLQRKIKDSRQ